MTEERLTDRERRALVFCALEELVRRGCAADPNLTSAVFKLSGTDTVLIAQRAYPSGVQP